jgi:hypothetical protein
VFSGVPTTNICIDPTIEHYWIVSGSRKQLICSDRPLYRGGLCGERSVAQSDRYMISDITASDISRVTCTVQPVSIPTGRVSHKMFVWMLDRKPINICISSFLKYPNFSQKLKILVNVRWYFTSTRTQYDTLLVSGEQTSEGLPAPCRTGRPDPPT